MKNIIDIENEVVSLLDNVKLAVASIEDDSIRINIANKITDLSIGINEMFDVLESKKEEDKSLEL